jgi:dUTP pyrophosphatase
MNYVGTYGLFVNNSGFENQLNKKNFSDAGLDLMCDLTKEIKLYSKTGLTIINDADLDEIILPSFSRIVLNTSTKVAVPDKHVGLIWDRSGLAANYGITILAGCVDHGYTGDVKVVMFNSSFDDYIIHNGDRIAQMLTVSCDLTKYLQVSMLEDTSRNSLGFGSSGR